MLEEKYLQEFLIEHYTHDVIEQANKSSKCSDYRIFFFEINLFQMMKDHSKICAMAIGNYPLFNSILQSTVLKILASHNYTKPLYGVKNQIYFKNCTIPRHNILSIDFLNAVSQQKNGALVYLKGAQISGIKDGELYLQSWTQLWEYQCQCKNQYNSFVKKKVTQTLLQILSQGSKNLKDIAKGKNISRLIDLCQDCKIPCRFIGTEDLAYQQCQQVQILCDNSNNLRKCQIFFNKPIKVLMDKSHLNKFEKGKMYDLCCYIRTTVQLNKAIGSKASPQWSSMLYLVCSYPEQNFLNPKNSTFFSKLIDLDLKQTFITSTSLVKEIVSNHRNFSQMINQIKFPYLGPNVLTSLKTIALSSLFCHQTMKQRLNLLIITDEPNMIERSLSIRELSIKKLPTTYDDKTLQEFFYSCHNSIVIVVNPGKKDSILVNKILKKEIYKNLNIVLWIISQPEDEGSLRKKIQFKCIEIILDITLEKNLNVCKSVYSTMVDDYLCSFLGQQELEYVNTAVKKLKGKHYQYEEQHLSINEGYSRELAKEEKIATQVLQGYFLKSRQYKTTQIDRIQTLSKIAQSFTQMRYFIQQKGAVILQKSKPQKQYLSVLDVILTIFVDEETSRNKYSSNNTLFAGDVSKVMLNQVNSNVSIWNYQSEDGFLQQSQKLIPRDHLVGIVVQKIFNLIYDEGAGF